MAILDHYIQLNRISAWFNKSVIDMVALLVRTPECIPECELHTVVDPVS